MRMITSRVIDEVVAQRPSGRRPASTCATSLNVSIRDLHGEEIVTQLTERLAAHRRAARADPGGDHRERADRRPGAAAGDDRAARRGRRRHLARRLRHGYSSLQHLRRLPLAEIKIDRSFVAGIAHNADDAVIVRSTVDLARALGLRVVAEGVENRYTARLLAEAGCGLAQGWLYAPPMPGDAVIAWLTRHPNTRLSHQRSAAGLRL